MRQFRALEVALTSATKKNVHQLFSKITTMTPLLLSWGTQTHISHNDSEDPLPSQQPDHGVRTLDHSRIVCLKDTHDIKLLNNDLMYVASRQRNYITACEIARISLILKYGYGAREDKVATKGV